MTKLLDRYARALDWIGRVELAIGRLCLATIVVCIFAQVVTRYGFDWPLAWVEELATYAFIWGTFLGASLALKRGAHLKVETVLDRAPERVRRLVLTVTQLAIGIFCLLLVLNGLKALWLFEWRQRTIALPIELPRYLFFSGPLILGSASMVLTIVYELLATAAGRPIPRASEAPIAA